MHQNNFKAKVRGKIKIWIFQNKILSFDEYKSGHCTPSYYNECYYNVRLLWRKSSSMTLPWLTTIPNTSFDEKHSMFLTHLFLYKSMSYFKSLVFLYSTRIKSAKWCLSTYFFCTLLLLFVFKGYLVVKQWFWNIFGNSLLLNI